jgi:hypothetical protein
MQAADQHIKSWGARSDGERNRRRAGRWPSVLLSGIQTACDAGSSSSVTLPGSAEPTHAFICYKHGDVRAKGILAQVSAALGEAHRMFFDQADTANLGWAKQIARELKRSDSIVVCLSNQSLNSEMIEAELAMARDSISPPRLLVLRLPTAGAPPYPLRQYLERANEIIFSGDIHQLAIDLRRALDGDSARRTQDEPTPSISSTNSGQTSAGQSAQPQPAESQRTEEPPAKPILPQPLPWASPQPPMHTPDQQPMLYIERPADAAALKAIQSQGVTLTITGARQVGKTSLLARTMAEARRQGKLALTIDFQLFEQPVLADPDRLFRYLCEVAGIGLGLDSCVDAYWGNLDNSSDCTRYFEDYLLPRLNAPLVLALDKIERIPDTAARSSFFSMLRAWCDNRATMPIWKQLDLVLVTSAEPDQLAANPHQAPFNAGLTIALDDFTPDQVAELNQRHGQPFAPAQMRALTTLLAGHPYLICRALYLAAAGQQTPDQIIDQAVDDSGPFGDHLRYQLFKLYSQPHLVDELRQIINCGACADERAFHELHSVGLVRREGERELARCRLYAAYFQKHLV